MIIFLFAYINVTKLLFYNTMILDKNNLLLENLHANTDSYDTYFINGAIGDFLLFDSFLNNEIRSKIKKIYIWNPFHPLNPKANLVEKLIRSNYNYNPQTQIKILSYPFDTGYNPQNNIKFCFDLHWLRSIIFNIVEKEKLNKNKIFIQHDIFLNATKDMQSLNNYKKTLRRIPTNSSYWHKDLCGNKLDKKFSFIKEKYCVIVPFTSQDRCFKPWDFTETFKILDKTLKMQGVILSGYEMNITHHNVVNLSTQTTINESIDIVKKANAFIGIDSFLSIVATECIDELKVIIKTETYGLNHPYFYNKVKNINNVIYDFVNYKKFSSNVKKNLKI